MKMTPDSRPSYLNDLIANLLLFVDQTEVRTQTGNNAPFNYRLVPYIAVSDHAVFLDAGIPAMQFNHWFDNFYHSSGDRAVNADPTELKRVAFWRARRRSSISRARARTTHVTSHGNRRRTARNGSSKWRARACACWTPTLRACTSATAPHATRWPARSIARKARSNRSATFHPTRP
jgi:hypothetical protein